MIKTTRLLALLLAVCSLTLDAQTVSGSWLDSHPKAWNRPGMPLPHAPAVDKGEDVLDCKPIYGGKGTAEEQAVTEAGWYLAASVDDGHGITVVTAAADFDGMCRPGQYQDFVFVNGKFAGTLSPILMWARSDGSSRNITFAAGKIRAEFSRYSLRDPLCCPSRISKATYDIRKLGAGGGEPVVVLTTVHTAASAQ